MKYFQSPIKFDLLRYDFKQWWRYLTYPREGKLKDKHLVYSAGARCKCGAGLAYRKNIGINGYWNCSAILKGMADISVEHTEKLPFVFYEVKSELQPNQPTTRPQSYAPKQ